MARLIHVIHGEMRGSIAGNTFSRNKSGMIVRYKATPTQPNNAGQMQARANFGASAVAFTNLSAAERQSWNDFASQGGGFIPLRKMNEGQFSGVNAFAALRSTAMSALNKAGTVTISPVGMPAPTIAPVDFILPTSAPVSSFSPSIEVTGTTPYGENPQLYLGVEDIVLNEDGAGNMIQFSVSPSPVAGSLQGLMSANAESKSAFGFLIYISESMNNAGMRSKNKFAYLLSSCKPIVFSNSVTAVDFTGFDLNFEFTPPLGKTRVVQSKFNDVTVVAVNSEGQTSVIGTRNVQVSQSS